MQDLLNYFLTQILIHGYPIILGAILLAYIGVPIPLNILILAAGAFTADQDLNIYVLISIVFASAFLGDIFHYYVGNRLGFFIVKKYGEKIGITSEKLLSVKKFLSKWGGGFIFITRWLLSPLGIPVNLMAGINNYPFRSFVIWVALGELMWSVIYIYTGHILGSNWVSLMDYVSDAPTLITVIFVGAASLFFGYRLFKNSRYNS